MKWIAECYLFLPLSHLFSGMTISFSLHTFRRGFLFNHMHYSSMEDTVFPYFDIRLLILSAQTIFVEPISPNKLPLQILNPFQRQKHLVIYGTLRSNEYPHRFRIQFSLSHLLYNHIYSLKRCLFFLCVGKYFAIH